MSDGIPAESQDDTREQLLDAAHAQFAERGFYGASIAQIAGEVGLTKQALLYHFKRKEELYREVLKRIADSLFEATRAEQRPDASPAQRFEDVILAIYERAAANPLDTKLLMRELLEDQRSEAPEGDWFFKNWLGEIITLLEAVEGQADLPMADKIARVYLLISAIQFYAGSDAVLTRFYGKEEFDRIGEFYPLELRRLVRRLLTNGHTAN